MARAESTFVAKLRAFATELSDAVTNGSKDNGSGDEQTALIHAHHRIRFIFTIIYREGKYFDAEIEEGVLSLLTFTYAKLLLPAIIELLRAWRVENWRYCISRTQSRLQPPCDHGSDSCWTRLL
eukprot:4136158-Pleurochrysis_carterae.AAC.1